ncbi:MAG: helix-turn-helix transcriptional regulator [Clostridia bacterium]|nr:helix-turn-helix transcriptional regulator [Clostridia bacterium]
MESRVVRRMFLGFIHLHILHHAAQEPVYGAWLIDELARHGYALSAGTLYPVLHALVKDGLIAGENRTVDGKVRKYYAATDAGRDALARAREKAYELFREVREP